MPNEFIDIQSPSGHSAISMAVYGTCAVIVSSTQTGWRRIIPYLFVCPWILLIAVSRVLIGGHTVEDVIIGTGIGSVILFCIWLLLIKEKTTKYSWLSYTGISFIAILFAHGMHFPAERIIQHFSQVIVAYKL